MKGKELRDKLLERKINFSEVARKLKISPQALNDRFKSDDLRLSFVLEVSGITEIPLNEIITGYEAPKVNSGNQGLQAKLIACMERKEELYSHQQTMYEEQKLLLERLVSSEAEKVKILQQKERETASTKAKQSASSK